MEPLVVFFDVISAVAFAVGLVYAVRLPLSPGRALEYGTKFVLIVMMALYVFVGISNILEHAGVTAALDALEDYAEVLFVPLIAYAAISSANAARLRREVQTQRELRVERDFSSAIMEATPVGIAFLDGSGSVVFANERARELLGVSADEAFSGGPVLIERDGALPEPKSLREIAESATLESRRFTVMGVDELTVLAFTGAPLAEEGTILSMLDVTARVLLDRELEQYRRDLEVLVERRTEQLVEANLELEAANAAKKAFLANMSHELRTPLNSVLGFSGVLLRDAADTLSAEQRKQIEMIRSAGEQLLALVDEVLDIARIESGHARLELGEVDLASLVRSVCDEFTVAVAEAGLTLGVDIEDGAFGVETDSGKLAQILRNLVANAVKFTPEGGEVSVILEHDGNDAVVKVRDTGVGIAPYDQERVFSAFYQACPPGETRSRGAGLGLAIVRQLSGVIGAEVAVQSAPGYGSQFTVRIPRSIIAPVP